MGEWGKKHYNGLAGISWTSFVNENKYRGTVVAVFGPTASGKSVARDVFVREGWDKVVSFTTRPPRPGSSEEDQAEYVFISKEKFGDLEKDNRLFNVNSSYAGNSYGTDKYALEESDRSIMITDKTSIPKLKKEVTALGKKLITVYVTAPPEELLRRQANRLETGEYQDKEQLAKRMSELKKEIEREEKVKSLATHVIMEKEISHTMEKAKALANKI